MSSARSPLAIRFSAQSALASVVEKTPWDVVHRGRVHAVVVGPDGRHRLVRAPAHDVGTGLSQRVELPGDHRLFLPTQSPVLVALGTVDVTVECHAYLQHYRSHVDSLRWLSVGTVKALLAVQTRRG